MAKVDIPKLKQSSQLAGNSYAQRDMEAKAKKDFSTTITTESDQHSKRVKQITVGKTRKQGLVGRFARYILEDTIESARDRAFSDIIRPGLKSLIFDTGIELLAVLIYGNTESGFRGPQSRSRAYYPDRTSYTSYYKGTTSKSDSRASYRDIPQDPDDVIVPSHQAANAVLRELDDNIFRYGQVSIADLYDCVGMTSDWTDNRYGWTSLRGATIRPVREGFMIVMPPTQILEN